MPFGFKEDKELNITVTNEILKNYLEEIVLLLREIFDKDFPFEEKLQ